MEFFSLGVTAEALRANIGSKSAIASTNHSFTQKIMLNDFSYVKQVAQLLQRDSAAGGLVMAKSGRLELGDNIYGHYSSILNYSDAFGQQSS